MYWTSNFNLQHTFYNNVPTTKANKIYRMKYEDDGRLICFVMSKAKQFKKKHSQILWC
jgi:hypothetical protein